jgi:transposase
VSSLSIAKYFPWCRMKVVYHNVLVESKSAMVRLEPDRRYSPLCHVCEQPARRVHSPTRKVVRDLDFADCRMLLQVEHRKIFCDGCRKVRVEKLDFVDASQRVTLRLAAYAAQLCAYGLSVSAVARHLDLDPKTVKAIDKTALTREFGATDYHGLKRLAIDEIAVRKGHHYMTVVLDYDTGRVVWMGEGRQIETLDEFFSQMPEIARNNIAAVALDMWDAYIHAVKKWCPNADIVFDLFHVVKAFNQVIDQVRNDEFKKADADGRRTLKGSKYLFLKTWDNLKREEKVRLNDIKTLNERLNTVYWLKDFLKHIWSYHRPAWAEAAIADWCSIARQDGHPALTRFANLLETHRYGIVNHCKHQIHTSKLEGVNNKIKVVKRIAYGFHDLDYFTLKVKQALPGQISDN